jgi:hypothetical protein
VHLVGFTIERQLQVCSTFLPALVQPALHFAFLRVLGVTSGIKIKEKKIPNIPGHTRRCQKRQCFSTTRTGLRDIPRDVQGDEGEKKQSPS